MFVHCPGEERRVAETKVNITERAVCVCVCVYVSCV